MGWMRTILLTVVLAGAGCFGATAAPAYTFRGGSVSGTTVGGDLSGTLPNPTVAKINGNSIASTAAAKGSLIAGSGAGAFGVLGAPGGDNRILVSDSGQALGWIAYDPAGDLTMSAGSFTIANGVVTSAKLATGAVDFTGNPGSITGVLAQANGGTGTSSTAKYAGICNFRLTGTTATAVTTSDVTNITTLYWTPYKGNTVALYDGSSTWALLTSTELSVALGATVPYQAYDVFAYNNSGTVALDSPVEWANETVTMTIASPCVVTWTGHGLLTGSSIAFTTSGALPTGLSANTQYFVTAVDANTFKLSTTPALVGAGTFINTSGSQSGTHTAHSPYARETALTLVNGVYCKSGATTRLYVGTFLATSTTQTQDTARQRLVFNYFNPEPRTLTRYETTASWTATNNTIRQANSSSTNQVEVMIGVAGPVATLTLSEMATNSSSNAGDIGFGINSTTAYSYSGTVTYIATPSGLTTATAALSYAPALGYSYIAWLENGGSSGTTTFYGTQAGAGGWNFGMTGRVNY